MGFKQVESTLRMACAIFHKIMTNQFTNLCVNKQHFNSKIHLIYYRIPLKIYIFK